MVCQNCGNTIYIMGIHDYEKDYEVPLIPGVKLYRCLTDKANYDFETVTGTVIENRLKKGLYGIRNQSSKTWKAVIPDQSVRDVPPGKAAPIWKGLEIDFGDNIKAKMLI